MVPYRSNSDKENCSPVSSNCVIWQGPDISCINLCKGDSISDIVYKLAVDLCAIKDSTDISQIDFNCLLDLCGGSPEPEITIAAVLQLMIDGICCSVSSLTETTVGLTARTSNLYEEPNVVLPPCLQYIDPATGLPVTSIILSEYALLLANSICDLRAIVNIHTSQIANQEIRIQTLENDPGYIPPTVVSPCSFGPITGGTPTEMNILLEALDSEFCDLVTVLGSNTNITNAGAEQCSLLGSQNALSQPGTMSGIPNWNNTISNFAQSMQNLWITVCDMRGAMASLKSCCAPDCSSFLFNYNAVLDPARTTLSLYFDGYGTVVPAGFANCPTLSTITVTDSDGHIYSNTSFDFTANLTSYTINDLIADYAFNPALAYTIVITACIVKDGVVCSRTVTQVLEPTPSTTTCPCYSWSVLVNATDLAAATGNTNTARNGVLFVDWTNCANGNVTTSFNTDGEALVGCSCKIPFAYYYVIDVKTTAIYSSFVFNGVCGAP
jgi:hypothetical protein